MATKFRCIVAFMAVPSLNLPLRSYCDGNVFVFPPWPVGLDSAADHDHSYVPGVSPSPPVLFRGPGSCELPPRAMGGRAESARAGSVGRASVAVVLDIWEIKKILAGEKRQPHQALSIFQEQISSKIIEVVVESVPGLVL